MKSFSEFGEVQEASAFENLPGKATHMTKQDIRHPDGGIISGSTTLRKIKGNQYEVRAGKHKGKIMTFDPAHVQGINEEVEPLDELEQSTLKSLAKKRGDQAFREQDPEKKAELAKKADKANWRHADAPKMITKKPAPKPPANTIGDGSAKTQKWGFGSNKGYGQGHYMGDSVEMNGNQIDEQELEMNPMDVYINAIQRDVDSTRIVAEETVTVANTDMPFYTGMIDRLVEKHLTPAELKKREEIAKAMERENPGMDKSKKMSIATAAAKRVAEEAGQIDENIEDRHAGIEEEKSHTVPKTSREKSLAALAEPKDKITHADVMTGRGVKKEKTDEAISNQDKEGLNARAARARPELERTKAVTRQYGGEKGAKNVEKGFRSTLKRDYKKADESIELDEADILSVDQLAKKFGKYVQIGGTPTEAEQFNRHIKKAAVQQNTTPADIHSKIKSAIKESVDPTTQAKLDAIQPQEQPVKAPDTVNPMANYVAAIDAYIKSQQ